MTGTAAGAPYRVVRGSFTHRGAAEANTCNFCSSHDENQRSVLLPDGWCSRRRPTHFRELAFSVATPGCGYSERATATPSGSRNRYREHDGTRRAATRPRSD